MKALSIQCPNCKYDLRAHVHPELPHLVRCPECGAEWEAYTQSEPRSAPPSQLSVLASIALPLPVFVALVFTGPFLGFADDGFFILLTFYPLIALVHLIAVPLHAMQGSDYPSKWNRAKVMFIWIGVTLFFDLMFTSVIAAIFGSFIRL